MVVVNGNINTSHMIVSTDTVEDISAIAYYLRQLPTAVFEAAIRVKSTHLIKSCFRTRKKI